MLDKTNFTASPAMTPVRVISGNSISKMKSWDARERARFAAKWRLGGILVTPTTKLAAAVFGVSVPYVMEAIADLKTAAAKNGNGNGSNGADAQLSLDDLWTHMDPDEQAMFATCPASGLPSRT
jgi:hypothetical protein